MDNDRELPALRPYYKLESSNWAQHEWGANPVLQVHEGKRFAARRASPGRLLAANVLGTLAMLSGFGFALAMLGYSDPSSADDKANCLLIAQICASVFLAPTLYFLFRMGERVLHPMPDLLVRMPLGMKLAWDDWQLAFSAVKDLDPNSDAAAAMAEQDTTLREAFAAYLTDEQLSHTHKREFERWFMQTCADAYELYRAENRRADLYQSLYSNPAVTAAVQSQPRLLQAKQDSEALSENMTELLRDKLDSVQLRELA